ncbi:DNA helicase [Microbacterium phage Luna18]|nr:DNA helicase [Microbacterium phage KatChan]URQ04893.1 DNA helicase [Microbacterium phage Luna18]
MTLQLRDSQRVALEVLTQPGRTFAALWAEPRSGKTAVSLKLIEHKAPRAVVVVGPKIAEGVWRSEAAKWLNMPYRFHPLTAGNQYPSFLAKGVFRLTHILFVNYEQFGKQPWKRLRPFLKELANLCDRKGMMLLDESHQIKTPNSVTGKNIRPLADDWQGYRMLITGTPVTNPNQIDAIYGQWTFLNPDIRDKWPTAKDFREYFGEWTNVKGYPELVRPIRQAELNAYIQGDVVTMVGPGEPVPIRKITYPIPAYVADMHKNMLKKGVIRFDDRTVVGLNPLTRLMRMRTLVGGWLKDDEGESFTVPEAARARLGALGKVMRKCDGKIIIACTHLWEIKLVRRYLRLKGIGHTIITGATKEKNHVIEAFQRDPDLRVLLVQPRTVSMAVDISVANDLIWYTSDFNYVTFKQTSDRIKLSPASPTVWFLCARDTVDEDVWTTLQEDHDHLTKVVKRIRQNKFPPGVARG